MDNGSVKGETLLFTLSRNIDCLIIIIMVIFKLNFSREHIVHSLIERCEHIIRKNQQIKCTVHDAK